MVARSCTIAGCLVLAGVLAAGCGDDDGQPTQSEARLSGPITAGMRGFPGTTTPVDLAARGYVEEEFFIEGEATSYRAVGTWSSDGEWSVQSDTTAPFTTRMLVRRPTDPNRANGHVLVEWFNVSSLIDIDVDFGFAAEEILRGGYVWVGVSAQRAGITSTGDGPFGPDALGLRAWDPERYASLDHPGDEFSYDIFTQVGQLLRSASGVDALGAIEPAHLIAIGESQSAFRMLTYVNAVHPVAAVYDGFLIHSRDGGGASLGTGPGTDTPKIARVRTDLGGPVFQLATETDLFELRPEAPFPEARQPDTERIRTWEMAGTAHADAFYLRGLYAQGLRQFDSFLDLRPVFPIANDGGQTFLVRAAVRHLSEWVSNGTPPPPAEPLEVIGDRIARDDDGNARRGLRTPYVDVPIATLTGEGGGLIGATEPFSPERLAALYPSREDYLEAFERATVDGVNAGFLLEEDTQALLAEARDGADRRDLNAAR